MDRTELDAARETIRLESELKVMRDENDRLRGSHVATADILRAVVKNPGPLADMAKQLTDEFHSQGEILSKIAGILHVAFRKDGETNVVEMARKAADCVIQRRQFEGVMSMAMSESVTPFPVVENSPTAMSFVPSGSLVPSADEFRRIMAMLDEAGVPQNTGGLRGRIESILKERESRSKMAMEYARNVGAAHDALSGCGVPVTTGKLVDRIKTLAAERDELRAQNVELRAQKIRRDIETPWSTRANPLDDATAAHIVHALDVAGLPSSEGSLGDRVWKLACKLRDVQSQSERLKSSWAAADGVLTEVRAIMKDAGLIADRASITKAMRDAIGRLQAAGSYGPTVLDRIKEKLTASGHFREDDSRPLLHAVDKLIADEAHHRKCLESERQAARKSVEDFAAIDDAIRAACVPTLGTIVGRVKNLADVKNLVADQLKTADRLVREAIGESHPANSTYADRVKILADHYRMLRNGQDGPISDIAEETNRSALYAPRHTRPAANVRLRVREIVEWSNRLAEQLEAERKRATDHHNKLLAIWDAAKVIPWHFYGPDMKIKGGIPALPEAIAALGKFAENRHDEVRKSADALASYLPDTPRDLWLPDQVRRLGEAYKAALAGGSASHPAGKPVLTDDEYHAIRRIALSSLSVGRSRTLAEVVQDLSTAHHKAKADIVEMRNGFDAKLKAERDKAHLEFRSQLDGAMDLLRSAHVDPDASLCSGIRELLSRIEHLDNCDPKAPAWLDAAVTIERCEVRPAWPGTFKFDINGVAESRKAACWAIWKAITDNGRNTT